MERFATGVAHNPDAIPPVRGTNVGRRNAIPDRIIPDRGQVCAYNVNPPNKECCDVFHEHETGS